MNYENFEFLIESGVAHIQLKRQEEANTLTAQFVYDLCDLVNVIENEKSVRSILLTSQKGNFFSAGGDLETFVEEGPNLPKFVEELLEIFHPTLSKLSNLNAPLIIAVDGVTAGVGFSYVLNASYVFASENATFRMAYSAVGLTPDGGATYYLPRIVGLRRAEELMLTNRQLSAKEALDWGIVNEIVATDDLEDVAFDFAKKIGNGPTFAYGNIRKLLLSSFNNNLDDQLSAEAKSIKAVSASHDVHEGMSAFLEKRDANFTGH